MRAMRWLFWLGGLLPLAAQVAVPAAATSPPGDSYVLGDSLGEGVAEVSHLKGLAQISVHIRGPRALEQLAQTPPNATVFLVLGTNDANGTIARLDKSIDDIVHAAQAKNIALIWLGPPCVQQSWDTRARPRSHPEGALCRHSRALCEHARSGALFRRPAGARRRAPQAQGLRSYVGEGRGRSRLCARVGTAGRAHESRRRAHPAADPAPADRNRLHGLDREGAVGTVVL
jgi:hypothetical protein